MRAHSIIKAIYVIGLFQQNSEIMKKAYILFCINLLISYLLGGTEVKMSTFT